MNRKLLLLDFVLAAVLIFAGFQFRSEWRAATEKEAAKLPVKVKPLPPPPFTPVPAPAAVMAIGYNTVAQKLLFDPSRNPDVVPEPKPAPPPPPPMPPLPVYHGMMNIDGVTAIMSERPDAAQVEVHPGEKIGPFKLVNIDSHELALEWNGQVIKKTLDELSDHGAAEPAQNTSRTAAANTAPPPPPRQEARGPGTAGMYGARDCQANDSYPAGAVVDGYRKVVVQTPFGNSCRWDPVSH